ncbi:MAG: DUF1566 domain-containing protein [Thermodesulfobacteriota bacterium]
MKKLSVLLATLLIFALLQGCAANTKPRLVNLGDGSCQDTNTGQMWKIGKSTAPVESLDEARAYIADLNKADTHKDWRLPTVYELYDLNYLFDLHLNGDCAIEREGKYWSGEKNGEGMAGAWEIAEQCDPERHYAPAGKGYVRAVRP